METKQVNVQDSSAQSATAKEIRKLGWLSSFSRQVLLARHALRAFVVLSDQMERFEADLTWRNSHNTAYDTLRLLRTLNEILSGVNRRTGRVSAPYEPSNRPVTFFLGETRRGRLLSVSTEKNGFLGRVYGTGFAADGLATQERGRWIGSDIDQRVAPFLAHEISRVRKGVGLSNKEIADSRCEGLLSATLWPLESEEAWQANELFAPFDHADPGAFDYWREWYQGFLDGKPLDWELQRRVALIRGEDWEKGPAHVAEKIEEIKADYLAEKLPQAETVEFDQATGKFFTVPVPVAKPDLLGATLSQVADALDDALANPSNGLSERSRETRVLRRTAAKYGNDPQRIEMDFTSVHAGLTRQIVNGDLPPSEENIALQSACDEGARGIRATHPEIAEHRRILTEQAMRELSVEEKATLEEALPVLKAISRADLAEEWEQDIPALVNDAIGPLPDSAPRLPGADEATRVFSRAAKIAVWLRMVKVINAIDGSAGYKAGRILTTVGALVGIGLKVLGIL